MPRRRVPRPLRVLAGFAGGLALWLLLAGPYHRLVGAVAGSAFRAEGEGAIAVSAGREVVIAGPVEQPRARVRVSMAPVTSNLVLLAALWMWDPRPLGRWKWGVIALAALAAGHVIAVIAAIHSGLAVSLEGATGERYGAAEANFWFALWQGYQVVGAWALAFGAFWATRRSAE
ncbi:MAG TPA: hypothetical protein VMS56_07510 [Thermoanaerobaculia bacterium]|nr:hypothetical protein [Thermoanaerobaculia bacterium]